LRLLLIEDDPDLGEGIRLALQREHYVVDWLQDGKSAWAALQTDDFDLLILDLGLPGMSGLELLSRARAAGQLTPVLILTARDAAEDRVRGLDAGADDYLIKPFDIHELKARIRALLRRAAGRAQTLLQVGDLVLDPATMQVTRQGESFTLPRREFTLLHELATSPGKVFSRDTLHQLIYGWSEEIDSNAIEVHIHHLRRKLGNELIRTVRGIGYALNTGKTHGQN
jgi:two-component system response regulator QseB